MPCMLRLVCLLAFWLAACAGSPAAPAAASAAARDETPAARRLRYDREIFGAVLAGLYRDGVANEVVDAVTAIDSKQNWPAHFVYACPICMPAFDAFRAYRARPGFFGDKMGRDTFGPGLPAAATAALCGDDPQALQRALQAMVQRWLEARQHELRLSPAERAEWADEMERRRLKGAEFLTVYKQQGLGGNFAWMEACPLCEAANGACQRP